MWPSKFESSERRTMLNNRNTRTDGRQNRIVFFIIGFVLSAAFAFAAFGLTHGVFHLSQSEIIEPCRKKLVGFFRLIEPGELSVGQLSKLTHVVFSSLSYSGKTIRFGDDKQRMNFEKMKGKADPFKVKTMFGLNIGDLKIFSNSTERRILAASITSFIDHHKLDGINLEWSDPKLLEGPETLVKVCKIIQNELSQLAASSQRSQPYIISMTCPRTKSVVDFESVLKYIDFLNVEVDNYYSSWERYNYFVGPPSPLFSDLAKNRNYNVDNTMKYYSCTTSKPNQLVMIFTFSGRFWRNVILPKDPIDTLWMTADYVNGRITGGWESWRDLEKKGWQVSNASWNPDSRTPYIWNPETRIYQAFENERSLKEKIRYAIEKNIGGVGVWSICQDDDDNTLLDVLSEGELCSGEKNQEINYKCD